MTLLEEVAGLLEELGLGDYNPPTGGDIFLGGMPATTDAAVVLTRQPGVESDSRLGYDEPVVLFRVRGTPNNATVAEARAQAIYDAIHGLANRRLPGGTWLVLGVGTQAGPIFAGRDTNARDEWSVAVRMELHRPTVNRS
ncbi:minor capsid protein [Kribbella sp. NPDC056951]|uniref:minor capsid protein n=1 Tax=Kribbella TaxID=182639 RepID=UPI0031D03554